jgi:hypothetical protein
MRNHVKGRILRATHQPYDRAIELGDPGLAGAVAGRQGARAMTGLLALAGFAAGFITALLLGTVFAMARISSSQERMQRKVRYWQGEAVHARAVAEQLIRQLAVRTGLEGEPPDWPAEGIG